MVEAAEVHPLNIFSSLAHPNKVQVCSLKLLQKTNENVINRSLGGAHLLKTTTLTDELIRKLLFTTQLSPGLTFEHH